MKKGIENIIVALVFILVIVVIGLVVRYNTITEDSHSAFSYVHDVMKEYEAEQKAQKRNYLDALEGYQDEDVAVDPTQEDTQNVVKVKAEEKVNVVEDALKGDENKAYAKQLESYGEESGGLQEGGGAPVVLQQPEKPQEHNGDTIANDIEAIIGE